jgi:hypothetical protein
MRMFLGFLQRDGTSQLSGLLQAMENDGHFISEIAQKNLSLVPSGLKATMILDPT